MFIITGGAGFIGSNIACELDHSAHDIVIIDTIGSDFNKWKNIEKRRLYDFIMPENTYQFLNSNFSKIDAVIHMGAISTTTESDIDLIIKNNLRLSIDLWNFCASNKKPFVYASSAATYGDGNHGFDDREDKSYLDILRPLNPYGWSKHTFDRFILNEISSGRPQPPKWIGLKFFNVYGPNEYHKGGQRSVAVQLHEQITTKKYVTLFKSDNPDYRDGEQQRDFVWVGDCVNAVLAGIMQPQIKSGLYNVGSGTAQSFKTLAEETFKQLGMTPDIRYIDLPENLRGKYQYYTKANMDKLRDSGFGFQSTPLHLGVQNYINNFLNNDDKFR